MCCWTASYIWVLRLSTKTSQVFRRTGGIRQVVGRSIKSSVAMEPYRHHSIVLFIDPLINIQTFVGGYGTFYSGRQMKMLSPSKSCMLHSWPLHPSLHTHLKEPSSSSIHVAPLKHRFASLHALCGDALPPSDRSLSTWRSTGNK